ncbi:MAG TPA: replication initiator [Pseudonocardiaceae bacterium]|nr:replication initiator [Pseudonocardiaceae bacterium]
MPTTCCARRAHGVRLRCSFAKVPDYQARGLVHFHALVRLGTIATPPSRILRPPPAAINATHLEQALTCAAVTSGS